MRKIGKVFPLFKKVLSVLPLLLAISSFTFFLIHLVPGDPVDFILKEGANEAEKNILRRELGLDQGLLSQYLSFLKDLSHLDLGHSIHRDESVKNLLKEEFPFTIRLTLFSLGLALFWGLFLGTLSVFKRLSFLKRFFDIFPVFLFSIPAFVSAPLLIWFFALHIPLLPVSGVGHWSHLILPSISLALPLGAILMKVTRTSLLEVLHLDYVRTAQAKGLSPAKIYFKHVLFNALIPVITIVGLQMGALLTGTVIIEVIFDRPGLGSLLFEAIVTRDYPLVQGLVLVITLIYIFVNRATDSLYVWVHPQMEEK